MGGNNGTKWQVLTIIAIAAEEDVVADEIGPSAEVRALGDEHLFDEREAVDDDAGRRAQRDTEQIAIDAWEGWEGLERHFVTAQQVEAADDRPGPWSRWRSFAHNTFFFFFSAQPAVSLRRFADDHNRHDFFHRLLWFLRWHDEALQLRRSVTSIAPQRCRYQRQQRQRRQ